VAFRTPSFTPEQTFYKMEKTTSDVRDISRTYEKYRLDTISNHEFIEKVREEDMFNHLMGFLLHTTANEGDQSHTTLNDMRVELDRRVLTHCPRLLRVEFSGCFLEKMDLVKLAHALRVRDAFPLQFLEPDGCVTPVDTATGFESGAVGPEKSNKRTLTVSFTECYLYNSMEDQTLANRFPSREDLGYLEVLELVKSETIE
jgi:hypothetical protein